MKERRKKENRKKQTKAEKNKRGGGAEAIVGRWELNDFVVHLS